MQKAFTSFLLMTLITTFSPILKAQNLVPNPSFEIYDTCPNLEDEIQYAVGWSKYSTLGTTPDYYNACDSGGPFCVPNGAGIHQDAHLGHAYAGVVTFYKLYPTYREHIGIQLSQPLIIGQKYFLSFYTTMGEDFGVSAPANNIGILLSTKSYDPQNPVPVNNFAHLYSTSVISDTTNWVHISGSFIADSVYKYCIIGNFFDNSHTDTVAWHSNSTTGYVAIDDVCISTDSLTCNGTGEGVNEINNSQIRIYPNPAHDFIEIKTNDVQAVALSDGLGRVIYASTTEISSPFQINTSSFSRGVYFLQVRGRGGSVVRKIVLQ